MTLTESKHKRPKLDPCPFCGGAAGISEGHPCWPFRIGREYRYWIDCTKCGARTEQMKTLRGAVSRWNKRADQT